MSKRCWRLLMPVLFVFGAMNVIAIVVPMTAATLENRAPEGGWLELVGGLVPTIGGLRTSFQ